MAGITYFTVLLSASGMLKGSHFILRPSVAVHKGFVFSTPSQSHPLKDHRICSKYLFEDAKENLP